MGVMSSPRFLSLYLLGVFLLLLLLPDSAAQYYGDVTSSPDYDSDYNATFDYSFFSNGSSEDLDRLTEQFLNRDKTEEDNGGQEEEKEVTVTMTTTRGTMEKGGVKVPNAAAFPVCLEIGTLLWTLVILLVLNSQQL